MCLPYLQRKLFPSIKLRSLRGGFACEAYKFTKDIFYVLSFAVAKLTKNVLIIRHSSAENLNIIYKNGIVYIALLLKNGFT